MPLSSYVDRPIYLGLMILIATACSGNKHKKGSESSLSGSSTQAVNAPGQSGDQKVGGVTNAPAVVATGNAKTTVGSGLTANFVWEATDLPACYEARNNLAVFVWRSQKTLKCNKATGTWEVGGAS